MTRALDLSLYLVLDPDLCRAPTMAGTARAAAAGGATVVQLRDKHADTAERVRAGLEIKAALAGTGVPLIVDDDLEAALAMDADGLHVGQEDMPARLARERLGPDKWLGVSVEDAAGLAAIDPEIVDYVGVGPVFATATKPDHKRPIGFAGLAALVADSPVPAVAIGGLKAGHAAEVLATGAQGLAVVSAICGQADPEAAARAISAAIARWRNG